MNRATRAIRRTTRFAFMVAAAGALAAACNTGADDAINGSSATAVPTAADSTLPMDAMISQFQAELPAVTSLGEDAPRSRDELIERFAAAVRDSSVTAVRAITLTQAEFAHLYFPTSIYARAPYAQPPAVNWLLLEQNSLKGELRLLREYGGRPFEIESVECAPAEVEGENRIVNTCVLRIRRGDVVEDVRLFGSIIERGGRYKLMSLANRL